MCRRQHGTAFSTYAEFSSENFVPNGAGVVSEEQEPVDVMLMRLQGEVEQLREHVIYISQAVRSLVTIVLRDEDDAVH